ncbi:MAG: DUF2029 domain-containing protein [Oscillatoriales cyanobacterium C42_A2020_001]|nr:DUF2029 domain-containing protein [Leptolyngbyaceae cyanobacterium C42_A2020_001]
MTLTILSFFLTDKVHAEKTESSHASLAEKMTQAFANKTFKILLVSICSFTISVYIFYTLLELYEYFIYPTSIKSFIDFKWFYLASKMTRAGINPYDFDSATYLKGFRKYFEINSNMKPVPFVYPPNIIPIVFPLSYLSSANAARIFFIINLVSFVLLLKGAVSLLNKKDLVWRVMCVLLCLSIFGATLNLSLGQFSSIAVCFLVWSIFYAKKGENAIAGLLLGISTIKPTLSVLFIPYFLFKKRYLLIFTSLLTSSALAVVGLWMSGNTNVLRFLRLYKDNSKVFFSHFFESPYTSPTRIDAGVIPAGLFPGNVDLINLMSALLIAILSASVVIFIYQNRKRGQFLLSSTFSYAEIALLACLSLVMGYAQPQNAVILVFVVVFLINFCQSQLKAYSGFDMFCLFFIVLCLVMHSHIAYRYFWHIYTATAGVAPFVRATIGLLPNYAIVSLIFSILTLKTSTLVDATD